LKGVRKMFHKILYPTDFSDRSREALPYLEKLKNAGTEEVVILNVIDSQGRYMSAEKKADRIAGRLNEIGIKTIIRVEEGIPTEEILRVEEEEEVSLIVLGSHGISNIKEMLLGSVSEKVIKNAKCPVLVVK
jgi:nucleotide-binding universal stress UspA family protein